MAVLIRFNKPCGVLCQFSRVDERKTLADFVPVPDVYPAGRLDYASEGLVLLTDDGRLQHAISAPATKQSPDAMLKRYLVQVEGRPRPGQIDALKSGVRLKDGLARARSVELLARRPGWLWKRKPPIRQRANQPTSWLEISLDQGRNRLVRRMTAACGLPALRLVRVAIGDWSVDGLEPGQWREVEV